MIYLISYDLNRPRGEDAYPNLINALKQDGATRILFSEWLVQSNASAKAVADRYNAHVDSNDGIFVCEVTSNSAYRNLQNQQHVVTSFFPKLRQVA